MTPPAFASASAVARPSFRATGHPDSTSRDMALLRSHLRRCGQEKGRWAEMQMAALSVHQFLAPRFATTLTLLLVVIVSVSMAV